MDSTIFEKLLLNKQISFNNGSIYLMSNRKILIDAEVFSELILLVNNSEDMAHKLYYSIKTTFMNGAAKNMGINFSFDFNNYFKWLTDIAMLEGWGKFEWHLLDKEKKNGVIIIENSAVASQLKGRTTIPCDHIVRGLIAGGASISLKDDIDAFEEECMALGDPKCKIIFKPSKDFKNNLKFKSQLYVSE